MNKREILFDKKINFSVPFAIKFNYFGLKIDFKLSLVFDN